MKKTILALILFSGAAAPPNGYGGDRYGDTLNPSQKNTVSPPDNAQNIANELNVSERNAAIAIDTAKIILEENSNIAVTINQDLSATVINTNTGERIQPCIDDIRIVQTSLDELIKKCYPDEHDPNGKILISGTFTLREGSYCYTGVLGNSLYVYCQPPLNLGFPQ